MNYEQKYKEALERATIAYRDEDRHVKASLERIFPELKESEDKRIKFMIESCVYASDLTSDDAAEIALNAIEDMYNWLFERP